MSVYNQVTSVARPYLGPATDKFLERQCKYLKVDPNSLAKTNLQDLSWLVKNAASLIMEAAQADKLAAAIRAI